MHEILFRGKRADNGKWTTGTPFFVKGGCKMIHAVAAHPDFLCEGNVYYSEGYPVIPDTVGQYTGLTDKNGRKIFEGDIVSAKFDEKYPENESRAIVEWGDFGWQTHQPGYDPDTITEFDRNLWLVIGNIHDNPELLKGGAQNYG